MVKALYDGRLATNIAGLKMKTPITGTAAGQQRPACCGDTCRYAELHRLGEPRCRLLFGNNITAAASIRRTGDRQYLCPFLRGLRQGS